MKKVLLLSVTFFAFIFASMAQDVIYQDDFESYTVGDYLAVQSAEWTTWSGAPGTGEDALISDEQAYSPTNSVKVEGVTDLVKPLGNKISGQYEVTFWYYVPSGYGGYYNLQHFEQPGIEWAIEVYFGSDGNAVVHAGGENAANFTFNHDEWFEITNIINLSGDKGELFINDGFIVEWQFSLTSQGNPGTNQLGSVNIYAGAPSGDTPMFYFDDFLYQQIPTVLFFDDFESYNLGGYLCEQSDWWVTWSGGTGGSEDAFIVDEQAYSPTQSLKIEGGSDIIGPFGDKTSGVYEVNFWYYIPAGYGGYYNIQHFEQAGIEWAYEVYFGEIAEGYLTADGSNYSFMYTQDDWIYIENVIDLDNDWAEVYIEGALIHEFVFSTQASGGAGTLQLGGIDIFAGAPQGETPLYYVDDFEWVEVSGSSDPAISVTPDEFTVAIAESQTEVETMTIENVGFANLDYEIDVVYDLGSDLKRTPVTEPTSKVKTYTLELGQAPNYKPNGLAPVKDDVILHYDGENSSAIGLTNGGQWEVAARFPNELLVDYVGMELIAIDMYNNEMVDGYQARVYGEGMNNQAGELLSSQDFTPNATSWNTILLGTPVVVTGEDLWVGYWIDQQVGGVYPAGVDEGPADPNGDFIKSGVAWGHLSDNPDLNFNWNIRATLTGTAQPNWLTVSPESGTIIPSDSEDVDVTFSGAGLENGSYYATIEVNSNDPEAPITYVDAMLDIITGVNEYGENNAIMLFPNPAQDYIKVRANHEISNVRMMNYVGQVVYESNTNTEFMEINTSDLQSGVYVIQIETTAGTITKQVIVK